MAPAARGKTLATVERRPSRAPSPPHENARAAMAVDFGVGMSPRRSPDVPLSPAPRWWLAARPSHPREPDTVVYENRRSRFFEYDSGTGKLHEASWLMYAFRHDEPGESEIGFTPLTSEQAGKLMAEGVGARDNPGLVAARKRDLHALDPRRVLPQIQRRT